METRQSKRGSNKRKYKQYGEDFVVVRIVMDDVTDSIVVFDEIMIQHDIDLVDDTEADRIDNRSEPEMLRRNNEHELTNLRVLQWFHDLTADLKETILTSQDVYQTSINYISHDNTVSNWITPDGPLCVPESNLDLFDPGRSKKTSMDIFVRGLVVGLTHTKKHKSKKLKSARKTGELETDGENPTKPPFGRIFESYFDLPNHHLNNIVVRDSNFRLTESTCTIAITTDVSFKTSLAAESKGGDKNIKIL